MPAQVPSSNAASLPPIPQNPLSDVQSLPGSTDDYAKALQEAYRRGAEAATRLQQQQMQTAVSCPDLQQFQPQLQQQQPTNDPTVIGSIVPNPLAAGQVASPTAPQIHHHAAGRPPTALSSSSATSSRSVSLPDMQSYAARAQIEEEKRKKRLARNRASARLRRLRKKNLVSSI
jgi:hypothetical protein